MEPLIYILSPSYSGSTLLTILLAAHPRVSTIGELKATAMGDIEKYDCSCGQRIRACGFWAEVRDRLARRGVPFDVADFGTRFRAEGRPVTDRLLRGNVRGPGFEKMRQMGIRLWPGSEKRLRVILEKNRALMEVVKEIQGGDLFLDGAKDPNRLMYFQRTGWFRSRAIYMVRDGRATTYSFTRHYPWDVARSAREWKRSIEECERVLDMFPDMPRMTLKYEDLCTAPEQRMAEVFDFLGLEPAETLADLGAVEHHIIGNSMRLTSCREIRLDTKWRAGLDERALGVFEQIAGDLNRRLGYGED